MSYSKPLLIDDVSGFNFVKEILKGDATYAINFDRVQWDSKHNCYVVIEFLLCDESQQVNPHSSHPNRYFQKNKMKFIKLWEISNKLEANLFLVNYAKKGTTHENKVLLMQVTDVDENDSVEPVKTINQKLTKEVFSDKFRKLNLRGK
jgi:hypothetical protein